MIASRRRVAVWATATAIGAVIAASVGAPQTASDQPASRAVVSGVVCRG